MRRIFLIMPGMAVLLVCMTPFTAKAGPELTPMMELTGTVDSVDLGERTIVINGARFRLATNHVLHGITVDGQDQTVLEAGERVGYQLDENNTGLIRKIMILPRRHPGNRP